MISRAISNITPSKTPFCSLQEICRRVLPFCNSNSLKEGISVHSPMIKLGVHDDLYLSNNLLSLYTKCYNVEQARSLFDEMLARDVVSWTGLISGYVRNEYYENAIELFDLMTGSDQKPNEYTFSTVLKACAGVCAFDQGMCVHASIMKLGYYSSPILGSNLIDLYTKCNYTDEAFKVFTDMNNGDTFFWTRMVSSLVEARKWGRALLLYLRMIRSRVSPNEFTFVKILSASSCLGLNIGKLVHAHLVKLGIGINLVLKTAIVDMYSKCHKMDDAVKIFNLTSETDVFLWSSIITGFAQNLNIREAINAFCQMEKSGISANNYTYSGILSACSLSTSLKVGKQVHSRVIIAGLDNDVSVGNTLINMYLKCTNKTNDALSVFRGIVSPNVISWTSLIAGFAENGLQNYSFEAFHEMQLFGVPPNSYTLSNILGACSTVQSSTQTKKVHGYIIKTNADNDIVVSNSLVDCYAGLGMLNEASKAIHSMNQKDVITYTSLATRLNQMGHHEMALKIIARMYEDDVSIDEYCLACFLSASAGLATLETGKQLHCFSLKSGFGNWISVSNGLVDLYGKCGSIQDVHKAFEEINEPDVVSWNGLIYGLASNGHISSSLSAFDDMRLKRVKPDSITFLLVLFSCSHGGLVDLGCEYFQSMEEKHDIEPHIDHYICLVDLLGRAGRLEKAMSVIETMPFKPNSLIYKTLLSACRLHKNIALGEQISKQGLHLDPYDPAFYVLLARMYDDIGRMDLGERFRKMMRDKGLRKNPGHSWMEMNKKVHLFTAGDRSHKNIEAIHEKIESLISEFKVRGDPYQDHRDSSSYHSEILAVAFGLLSLPSKAPIRIIKNLRICNDCHSFMVSVTQLFDREIVIRDGNRFHAFKKGECSCNGYW